MAANKWDDFSVKLQQHSDGLVKLPNSRVFTRESSEKRSNKLVHCTYLIMVRTTNKKMSKVGIESRTTTLNGTPNSRESNIKISGLGIEIVV